MFFLWINVWFKFKLASKIKYEQKYLDDELRKHINELLEQLVNVPSDDENEDKENGEENEDDYDTLSEEEEDEENDINNNEFKLVDSKLSNESVKLKKGISNKSKNKNHDEPMEMT